MKIRTWKYYAEQGIRGIFKNGLMSLASIIVVSACALIVILSLAIITNVDYILKQIESNIGIELFIGNTVTDSQIDSLKRQIEAMPHVSEVTYCSAQEALEKAKDIWGGDALNGLAEDNPLPRSLEVKLDGIRYQKEFISSVTALQQSFESELLGIAPSEGSTQATTAAQAAAQGTAGLSLFSNEVNAEPATANAAAATQAANVQSATQATTALPGSDTGTASPSVKQEAATELATAASSAPQIGETGYEYKGIEYIRHAQQLTDSLVTVDAIFKIVALALLAILSIVAIGIIMNTIKLTVFIRKNEISIMKYVGATDWFIRWPFIIEGVVIGLVGAVIPSVLCWIGYRELVVYFNENVTILNDIIHLRPANEIFVIIAPISLLVGALLGGIGSISSVRKHLRV